MIGYSENKLSGPVPEISNHGSGLSFFDHNRYREKRNQVIRENESGIIAQWERFLDYKIIFRFNNIVYEQIVHSSDLQNALPGKYPG